MPRQTRAANAPEDTRMQRERLQEEQAAEQQARAGELSMITATQQADEADGVWNGQTGQLVESGLTEEEAERLRRENAALADDDEVISEEVARRGSLGEHMVRTDGPHIGPNGVPIDEWIASQDEEDESVITAVPSVNTRPGEVPEVREVEDLPRVGAGERARTPVRVDRTQQTRIIRLNSTLDPTIGRENYHFERGKRYEVPLHVANHLHEKGYVSSFG